MVKQGLCQTDIMKTVSKTFDSSPLSIIMVLMAALQCSLCLLRFLYAHRALLIVLQASSD